jgi:hypothetical protein
MTPRLSCRDDADDVAAHREDHRDGHAIQFSDRDLPPFRQAVPLEPHMIGL